MKNTTEKNQVLKISPLFGYDEPIPRMGKSWSDVKVGDYYLYDESPWEVCRKLSENEFEFWDRNGVYVGERYALIMDGKHFYIGGNDENH